MSLVCLDGLVHVETDSLGHGCWNDRMYGFPSKWLYANVPALPAHYNHAVDPGNR